MNAQILRLHTLSAQNKHVATRGRRVFFLFTVMNKIIIIEKQHIVVGTPTERRGFFGQLLLSIK